MFRTLKVFVTLKEHHEMLTKWTLGMQYYSLIVQINA